MAYDRRGGFTHSNEDRVTLSRLELALLRQLVSTSACLQELHFCFSPQTCTHIGEAVDLFAAFNTSTSLRRITIELPVDAALEHIKPWLQDLRVPVTLVLQRSTFRMREVQEFARWADKKLPSLAFSVATLLGKTDQKSRRTLSRMLRKLPVTQLELHDPGAVAPLCEALARTSTLESLFIRGLQGNVDACGDALRRNASIKDLAIELSDHSAKQIFNSLVPNTRLESLEVRYSELSSFGPDVTQELAGLVANNRSLKSIALSGFKLSRVQAENPINDAGATTLKLSRASAASLINAAAANTRLEQLAWTSMGDMDSPELLADFLQQLKGLKKLYLAGYQVIPAVANILETNTSVTEFEVQTQAEESIKALARLVEKNRGIEILRLHIGTNEYSESLVEALASSTSPVQFYGLGEQVSESIRNERARLALQSSSLTQVQES